MDVRPRRLAAAALVLLLAGAARAEPFPVAAGAAIAGPALSCDCRGERGAAPTVILEAGAFGTSADWAYVLDDLAAGGRVCAYDRAGLGRSARGAGGTDVLSRARELNALLDQLGETAPVIVVGHSNGALYAQAFADLFPERVAGLVYVNGVVSDAADSPRALADLRAERRASDLAVAAGRLGLSGLVAAALDGPMRLSGEAARRKRRGLLALARLKVARDEDRQIIPGLAAVRALPDAARHVPTAIIVGDPDPGARLARAWEAAEIAPAARADHAWVLRAPGASHVTPLTRDRAYVAAAVRWLRAPRSPDAGVGH
jgi:pimeloyl-ACP methyl ester carboxylesterase